MINYTFLVDGFMVGGMLCGMLSDRDAEAIRKDFAERNLIYTWENVKLAAYKFYN